MSKKFNATVEKQEKGWIVNIRVYKSGLSEAQAFIADQFEAIRDAQVENDDSAS